MRILPGIVQPFRAGVQFLMALTLMKTMTAAGLFLVKDLISMT